MGRDMTMNGLAKELGLSRTTVSVCLSGNHKRYKINERTVERVKRHAMRVGYVPNASAANLVSKSASASNSPVGLLMLGRSEMEKNVLTINHTVNSLENCGRKSHFLSCQLDGFRDSVAYFKSLGISDIIVFASFSNHYINESDVNELIPLARSMNLFFIDYYVDADSPPLNSENTYALGVNRGELYLQLFSIAESDSVAKTAIWATSHCGLPHFLPTEKRTHVSLKVFGTFSKTPNSFDFDYGRELATEFLRRRKKNEDSVVFTHDDKVAIGFIAELTDRNVRVPDDVKVMGFDNLEIGKYCKVPISTVSLPLTKHVDICLEAIVNGKEIPRRIVSEAEIIWRESFPYE